MLRFPNCKINLGLYVTNKRADGYHDIETVFYPLAAKDVLEIVPAKAERLVITGIEIAGGEENNLIWKAYKLLQIIHADKVPPLAVYLHKVLPMGAGLGGGSADGAFMLQMINDYCELNLSNDELIGLALQLGSDCPFFIYNTSQFAAGRGEVMTPVNIDLSGYSLQIICPEVHVSTAKAFQLIRPEPAAFDLKKLPGIPVAEWKNNIGNDFEAPVFAMHPVLSDVKQQLYNKGALYVAMSGSGSAIFGIFNKMQKAEINVPVAHKAFYVE